MTDRELLELAAKAAGECVVASVAEMHGCTDESTIYPGVMLAGIQEPWSPLTDDGDAQRLAVRLYLTVSIEGYSAAEERQRTKAAHPMIGSLSVNHGADPYAATRRAIVRAAAEIGRGME